MKRFVKIYYTKIIEQDGKLREELATELVPFDLGDVIYDEKMSYEDNFQSFLFDAFESGFVFASPERAISILAIKEFVAHKPQQQQQKKKQRRPKRKKDINEGTSNDEVGQSSEVKKPTHRMIKESKSVPERIESSDEPNAIKDTEASETLS